MWGRVVFILTGIAILVWVFDADGQSGTAQPSPDEILAERGPEENVYCGLVGFAAAARLLGKDVRVSSLADNPRYVTLSRGSSLYQLGAAANDYGLYSAAVEDVSIDDIKSSPHPIILHVREFPTAKEFNHYVLYLGPGMITRICLIRTGTGMRWILVNSAN